ncbi:MAG TPA: metalloregulator ArsR/SmtB family transcription factor [Dehalococcoidia bacterium]|jgi:DNA-binding transcriptional ArsR family regulator
MSPAVRKLDDAAPIFAALGDETRLGLVSRLAAGKPMSIVTLTSGTDVTRQAVTRHLQVLESAGLVRGMRRGRERLWQIDPAQLQEARRCIDHISEWWDEKLARLKASVEE